MNGLSAQEVQELQRRLRAEHAQLRREVTDELRQSQQNQYLELAGRVHDRGEEAVADLLGDLEITALDRHVQRVRLVESALAAITQGAYGLCRDCGAQIGSARLHADPAVERCVDCQAALERGQHAPTL
jgi:RNA polymerase-binding protein DksA